MVEHDLEDWQLEPAQDCVRCGAPSSCPPEGPDYCSDCLAGVISDGTAKRLKQERYLAGLNEYYDNYPLGDI